MLTDTGPLVALIDRNDKHHDACVNVTKSAVGRKLETTWACFTEAHYILGNLGGYAFQDRLWTFRRAGRLGLLQIEADEADKMDALISKYRDVPMSLADASLMAVAETRSISRIFTLDSDFYIYRLENGSVLEVIR